MKLSPSPWYFGVFLMVLLFSLTSAPVEAGLCYMYTVAEVKLYQPPGVAATEDFLYVLDTGTRKRVLHYNIERSEAGSALRSEGEFGFEDETKLYYPLGIAVGNNRVYVSDFTDRVFMYELDRFFIKTFGTTSVENGQFSYPRHIAVDRFGAVYPMFKG